VRFRAVLLCSRPGLRHGCYWEVIGPPFLTESEAARRCAFVYGLGGCREWAVQLETA
jgi:hypothetical protein